MSKAGFGVSVSRKKRRPWNGILHQGVRERHVLHCMSYSSVGRGGGEKKLSEERKRAGVGRWYVSHRHDHQEEDNVFFLL